MTKNILAQGRRGHILPRARVASRLGVYLASAGARLMKPAGFTLMPAPPAGATLTHRRSIWSIRTQYDEVLAPIDGRAGTAPALQLHHSRR
jgi:hypothetical protein